MNHPSYSHKLLAALEWITSILDFKRVPYHLTGGFAASVYGADREVNDIDIDIPHDRLPELLPSISSYITAGPERQKDGTWDVFLVCLDYGGQLLDLTTTESPSVCDKSSGEWFPLRMNFSDVVHMKVGELNVSVQNPQDLIEYKSRIGFGEQKHLDDVAAVRSWTGHKAD